MKVRRRASAVPLVVSGLALALAALCIAFLIGLGISPTSRWVSALFPAWIALCVVRTLDPIARAVAFQSHQFLPIALGLAALAVLILAFSGGPPDYGVDYVVLPLALMLLVGTFIQFALDLKRARHPSTTSET